MKDLSPIACEMNAIEITGNAVLCFEEGGTNFQGVIQADDDTQYAMYGTKSVKPMRRWSQAVTDSTETSQSCGCQDEGEGPGVPVAYDIRIVDCEVGDEYNLHRVHGRNGKEVSLRCKAVNFSTAQTYKGQRADMEAQRVIGHKMLGRRGTVFEGPIQIVAKSLQNARPWVL